MKHDRYCPIIFPVTLAVAAWLASGCDARQQAAPAKAEARAAPPTNVPTGRTADKGQRVREPAVAGLFYPKDPAVLAHTIDSLLAAAPAHNLANVKALVCPHAGYLYSGPTAAAAYKQLLGRDFKTVIVLAPTHYAHFQGACVSAADGFKTPLGTVPVWEKANELAKTPPFVLESPALVQRPRWSSQASRPTPAQGEDTPDTWEHSDEVQVPFLQRVLKDFKVLTIVLGEVDPERVARGLAPHLDDKTLLVASSDLSHYHPYEKARELDARCVTALTNLNFAQMGDAEACGKSPILTVMNLAKLKGWKARLLDYRNSGDTAGDKSGVVGYAAVAFTEPGRDAEAKVAQETCTKEEKKFLMDLAKKTVRAVVTKAPAPAVDEKTLPQRLLEIKGCFVTLTKQGQLRGCIGHIIPQEPLYKAVMENAHSAALRDYRFPPVEPGELGELEFEVSILTPPQPLEFSSPDDLLKKLQPHKDGVVLKLGARSSTFLPQVWEQIPDKVEFLNRLALKAGAAATDWRKPGTSVSIYHVEAFKETEL